MTATPAISNSIGHAAQPTRDRIDVLGLGIDNITSSIAIERMVDAVARGDRCLGLHVNAHLLNLACDRPWLRSFVNEAEIVLCDSVGAQLAGMVLSGELLVRNTPPDWIEALGRRLGERAGSMFWFGGSAQVVEAAATNFERRTGARAAGWHHGHIDLSTGSAESEEVVAAIRAARPDVLIVNLGMPRQEEWLYNNWRRLEAPVAITGGALVDHVAGRVSRPPAWVTMCGLEWAARLAAEPRRLWRRYLVGLPIFGARLLREVILRRWVSGSHVAARTRAPERSR